MDLKAVAQSLVSAVNSAPVSVRQIQSVATSTSQPSAAAQQLIQYVSQSEAIPEDARAALIAQAAMIDQFVNNPSSQHEEFMNVSGLAVYVAENSDGNFPRWGLLTGLRYYANYRIQAGKAPEPVVRQVVEKNVDKAVEVATGTPAVQARQVVAVQRTEQPQQFVEKVKNVTKTTVKTEV